MTQRYPAGPQSLLRAINERAVLALIDREGPLPRVEVARRTGLSKPTVSAALASLLERRAVEEVGVVTGRKGPAAILYRVDPGCAWSLGVDLGHERVRVAVADATGEVRAREEAAVRHEPIALVAQVAALCERAATEAGTRLAEVTQLVIGVPAVVGADGRELTYAEGLPGGGRGLGTALAAALPAPLVLENDVNLAALAERSQGAGAGVDDFVLVSLGNGLGLGVVIGGRLHRGATGAAGEAGYLPSECATSSHAQPPLTRDLVEAYIGAVYIKAQARRRGLGAELTPRDIFALARTGEPRALEVVDDTAREIAYVIACVAPLLDPSLVVLGGAIGANGDLLLAPVRRHLTGFSPFSPRIESSTLGSGAVLLGAMVMATELAKTAAFTTITGSPSESA